MPQQRGELTEKQAERITSAMHALEAAQTERDKAIASALKAGASVRVLAEFTGLSPTTVSKIGHMNGWPTPAQKQQWADERAANEAWRKFGPASTQ